MNGPDNNDKAPVGVSGSFIVGAACAAFMIAIVVSGVIFPADSAPEKIGVIPPIVARGESIFNGEGCSSCHSRLVRKNDQGMGQALSFVEYSASAFSPGSSRIGPDLQNISGKFSRSFLETRLEDPSAIQPDTLMPSYSHLSDRARNALIAYLEQPISPPGVWDNIRTRNGIEPEVSDSILESLKKYIDFDTAEIHLPIENTVQYLIEGRGIFGSRCAACHGINGRGNGPVMSRGDIAGKNPRVVKVYPVGDFTSGNLKEYSPVMIYWRIADGVPGTGMPSWAGSLSEAAIWRLVNYVGELAGAPELQRIIESETERTDESASEEEGDENPADEASIGTDESGAGSDGFRKSTENGEDVP